MNSQYGTTLRRIAAANQRMASGPGWGQNHFIPVCSINNRVLGARFKQRLLEEEVAVKAKNERLCTRFYVRAGDLPQALRIHKELLAESPDIAPRKFSRDYDSIFLLMPLTLLAAYISYASPWLSNYIWIAILTSGLTVVMLCERINRQYRYQSGSRWGIRELLWATAATAINIAVWQAVT